MALELFLQSSRASTLCRQTNTASQREYIWYKAKLLVPAQEKPEPKLREGAFSRFSEAFVDKLNTKSISLRNQSDMNNDVHSQQTIQSIQSCLFQTTSL